jgi:hypothetical protein
MIGAAHSTGLAKIDNNDEKDVEMIVSNNVCLDDQANVSRRERSRTSSAEWVNNISSPGADSAVPPDRISAKSDAAARKSKPTNHDMKVYAIENDDPCVVSFDASDASIEQMLLVSASALPDNILFEKDSDFNDSPIQNREVKSSSKDWVIASNPRSRTSSINP